MGSSPSKPEAVFHGETPVQFGHTLVSSLQSSSENDSTRQKSLELHIQSRVADELARLEKRETEVLASLEVDEGLRGDRGEVAKEIQELKRRLGELPRVRGLEGGLERAREGVRKCLLEKETRPLDCWKEVEDFKEQTRRMEKAFVVRTVGREY